ncbi:unnamed protein product [Adineta steineri]|uniref:G-protein coupled receptors family 1 profile domain-containing protein n=1 Tax=Adineta steineri TaxID=433720 RepID=A0A819KLX5_9BILA|nr:unnamed protein product [Adineta steineri]CAF3947129.1 unnamed protein product [Adineta steineri]
MNNQTDSNDSVVSDGTCIITQTQRSITMPILILFAIPSLICFLFIFYHFFKLRKRLIYDSVNHHVILFILILDFLLILSELPITLYYLALGNVQTKNICIFWIYWDYSLETSSLFLTMYAAIERYFLVFHKHHILKHKYLFHYIPMFIIGFYIPIIYFYLVILSPCAMDHPYDITSFVCGGACFFSYVAVNTYDTIVDTLVPCLILLIFNLLIILRVIIARGRVFATQSLIDILKKNRRMILQLFGISFMCLLSWMPWVVIIIAQNFFIPTFGNWFITYMLHYLPYITASTSPFLALIGLPEIRKHLNISKYQTKTSTAATKSTTAPAMPSEIPEKNNFD